MPKPNIALQLWTVRAQTEADYDGTLCAVAQSGYTAVEPWTLHSLTAAELRTACDAHGLRVPAMHFGYARLLSDLDNVVAEAHTLGCDYVVCSGLPASPRLDDWRAASDDLNEVGLRCREQNLQLAYHNEYDFAPLGNTCGFEILVNRLDVNLVKFQLDVFCAAVCGADPIIWLQRLHKRVPLVHLENGVPDARPVRTATWLGEGVLPIHKIVQATCDAGAQWLIVEHDVAQPDPVQGAARSLEILRWRE